MWVLAGFGRAAGQVPDPQHEHGPGRDPAHRRARAQPQGQQVLMIDALVFLATLCTLNILFLLFWSILDIELFFADTCPKS